MYTETRQVNIKGMNLPELREWVARLGEKPFRAKQLYRWQYQKGARSFAEMLNLPKPLRERLTTTATVTSATIETRRLSRRDTSTKYLFRLADNRFTEAVFMTEERRNTVCLSTMVGCPIGCPYCATGEMGLERNLHAGEIIDQLILIRRDRNVRITNVVFMGMGEPFLNYAAVIKAARIMNSELGPGIAARRITLSTCGIVPAIYRFTDEGHKFKLAVSLNGTTNVQRDRLVPINTKYPLAKLLQSLSYYTQHAKRRVTFEYILMAGENDSAVDARRLLKMLSPIPCKLNIIPYNQTVLSAYRAPSEEQLQQFVRWIYRAPFAVTVRRSKGRDIDAACGQLYARNEQKLYAD